jgi:hypothetical protein
LAETTIRSANAPQVDFGAMCFSGDVRAMNRKNHRRRSL